MSDHERWRTGGKNPYTVYRVADGERDEQHTREHFLGSFRREDDARRAVEAVNASAPPVDHGVPPPGSDAIEWERNRAHDEINEARGALRDLGYDFGIPGQRLAGMIRTFVAQEQARVAATVDQPEVVTGPEAMLLGVGSRLVMCDESGVPCEGFKVIDRLAMGPPHEGKDLRWRVLHRVERPEAPREPLRVGEVVETAEDLERLPVGAAVRPKSGGVAERYTDGWCFTDGARCVLWVYLPARILDLPGDGQDTAGGERGE